MIKNKVKLYNCLKRLNSNQSVKRKYIKKKQLPGSIWSFGGLIRSFGGIIRSIEGTIRSIEGSIRSFSGSTWSFGGLIRSFGGRENI